MSGVEGLTVVRAGLAGGPLSVAFPLPAISVATAGRLARDLFGIDGPVRELPGERDRNFHVASGDAGGFVLKVANAADRRDTLDMQNRILGCVAERAPELAVPRVCLTSTGAAIAEARGDTGDPHLVRLLTWVPGQLLAETRPHSPDLLCSFGRVMGTLDRALAGFDHPGAHRPLKWDLARARWIEDYLDHLADPRRRGIIEAICSRFRRDVEPVLPGLRAGVIQNDANDYNVLVGGPPDRRVVAGLIDFGDVVHSAVVGELAVAAAYAALGKPDPVSAAAMVVAGYHEAAPLSEPELSVLDGLIRMRLAVSVTNAAYQRSAEPNNAYLTVSEAPAWDALERFETVAPALAHAVYRDACGLAPVARAVAVETWLRDNAGQMGRLVEPDLRTSKLSVFDLGVGSTELGTRAHLLDTGLLSADLFARMRAEGAAAGVGKYDEARAIYASDAFRVEGNDGPEWRTVHIGLDFFLPAGAPVFAPMDGCVDSFRDNTGDRDYGPTIVLRHDVDGGRLTFHTLYGHLSRESLIGLHEGMTVARGQRIATLGEAAVNGGWPPHLHFQLITDLLDRTGEFPGVARPSQRRVWLSLSPDPNLVTRIPADRLPTPPEPLREILAHRRTRIGRSLSLSYRTPLQMSRGWMQWLYDQDGRAYLDCVNNVPHVGHCHPRVVEAGQRQMAVLNTNSRYLHELMTRYAGRLAETLPDPLRVCFFVCSGSEANELALRMARAHTRRHDVVVVESGYHGNTTTLVNVSPYKFDGPGGNGAPPWVQVVPMPDVYRGVHRRGDPAAGRHYAEEVGRAARRAAGRGDGVAAFLCESVLSCGGQIVLPDGYLREAYRHIRAAGGVCIADEVQTGFGRVGTHAWAFETQGVVPDIVTMGKPMGNGHPLGAVVTTPEIAASFANGMEYFNTFGGNPVSCAIGLAVLDVIQTEGLQGHALRVGGYLLDRLRELMPRHPVIGDVRGLGLFVGVELVRDRGTLEPAGEEASYVANRMKEGGVLMSTDGPWHNVLKIKPPLVFTEADADFLAATLDRVLGEDFIRRA
jgi:4-aminobutyrate aminotransferase-like enzyme/Ser/Thr protein kinase RdoA (MazF antagonist)